MTVSSVPTMKNKTAPSSSSSSEDASSPTLKEPKPHDDTNGEVNGDENQASDEELRQKELV